MNYPMLLAAVTLPKVLAGIATLLALVAAMMLFQRDAPLRYEVPAFLMVTLAGAFLNAADSSHGRVWLGVVAFVPTLVGIGLYFQWRTVQGRS
jgi:hypothetical protein